MSVTNVRQKLAAFLGYSHDGERDLYASFGYKRTLLAEDFYAMYKRNDIANRLVRAFPQSTWREFPAIYDRQGKTEEDSEFAASVCDFVDQYKLQQALERVDRVSSIGRFGLLFMGFQDGLDPSQPLEAGNRKLLYLQPYGEYNVTVSKWDQNIQSPRYALPETYIVNSGSPDGENSAPGKSLTVHHSRVIHLTEFLDDNEVYGTPRLMAPYNRLKDLEKVVGGSAETFWLTANRGMAFWADKEANLTEAEIESVKEQADDFQNQLRRFVVGQGMTAQVLGSDTPDPQPNVETLLDLIAGSVGIPKRILVGSERGEMASSQDENNWFARIDERRTNYATPCILQTFIDKMIATGNIVEPKGKVSIEWPEVGAMGPTQEAEILEKRTNALSSYVMAPGADLIVPPDEFRTDFLGLESKTPEEMLEDEELFADEEIEEPIEQEVPSDEKPSNILPLQG